MIDFLMELFVITTIGYIITLFFFWLGLFFPNRRRHNGQPFVSVVIAARNEEHNIANILKDLTEQTYPHDRFEVIVVNDHSTDNTAALIDRFCNQHTNIRLLHAVPDRSGKLTAKKNAIQQGIALSEGDIILTTDADCRVQPGWVSTMVSYFTPEVGMVVGFSQFGSYGEKRSVFEQLQAIDFLALMTGAEGALNLGLPLSATGQNLAYRREAFREVGGFKRIGHRISGDDVLLLQLIHKKTDWKIRFAPDSKSYNVTHPEKTVHGFFNQRKRWASNGSYQFVLNKLFFLICLNALLMNLLSLTMLPIALYTGHAWIRILGCLIVKGLAEFTVVFAGARLHNRNDLLKYFPAWVVLQIPYVVYAGLLGNTGQFVWKGRTHNNLAQKRIIDAEDTAPTGR
jgi:cellulose synthase/poly-beta-1,6-N-acetylglucosamine synthase-like glycosyltransferase